jgi:hypothetical protein
MVTNVAWKVVQSITISLLCLLSLVESQNLTISQRFLGAVGGTLLDSASASVATDGLRNNTYILTHKGIYVFDHNTNGTICKTFLHFLTFPAKRRGPLSEK